MCYLINGVKNANCKIHFCNLRFSCCFYDNSIFLATKEKYSFNPAQSNCQSSSSLSISSVVGKLQRIPQENNNFVNLSI